MFVSPTVVGEALIIGSCAGSVYALDRNNGDALWLYDSAADGTSAEFHGEPLLIAGGIIVPSDANPTGHLYKFDASNGDLKWKVAFPHGVATTPLRMSGGELIVVSATGTVASIDATDGRVLWRSAPDGSREPIPGLPSPAAAKGRIFVASNSGALFAISGKDGKVLWRKDLGTRANTSLATVGNDVYVGGSDGQLYRLDGATGAMRGTYRLGRMVYGSLLAIDGTLLALVAGDGAQLIAFDTGTGKVRWRQSTAREWTTYRPLVSGSTVIAGDEGKELCAFALEDGARQWCRNIGHIPRGLGSSDGILYVGTLGGKVLAYRLPQG